MTLFVSVFIGYFVVILFILLSYTMLLHASVCCESISYFFGFWIIYLGIFSITDWLKKTDSLNDNLTIKDTLEIPEIQQIIKFISAINDPMALFQIKTFQILAINDAVKKCYGYEESEVIGHYIWEFSAEPEKTKAYLLGLKENTTNPAIRLHKRKTGELFTAQLSTNILQIAGKWIGLTMIRDVTEEQTQSRLLKQQVAWAESILTHSSDWILVFSPELKISYCSPSVQRILEFSP
ncbi:MAG: PAS domain S-box protein, partial [Bacteroidia bacterium]|nr:PAS domain S-box protein [Bacteroidia bacterium]